MVISYGLNIVRVITSCFSAHCFVVAFGRVLTIIDGIKTMSVPHFCMSCMLGNIIDLILQEFCTIMISYSKFYIHCHFEDYTCNSVSVVAFN